MKYNAPLQEIAEARIHVASKKALFIGIGFKPQILEFSEFSDWRSIKDEDGNNILNVQLDFDERIVVQYVDLIPTGNTEQSYVMGDNWRNPETLVETDDDLEVQLQEFIDGLQRSCPNCGSENIRMDFDSPCTMQCCDDCGSDFLHNGEIVLNLKEIS